jgi:hypothetical protein
LKLVNKKVTYQGDEFFALFEPKGDKPEHMNNKVVDDIYVVRRIFSSLEKKVDKDIQMSSKILSCFKCS